MSDTFKAVTLVDTKKAEVREYPMLSCGKNEVLVRNMCCAICTVDQRAFSGITKTHYPVVQGHEGVGVVEAVGEGVTTVKVGDHVVANREFCGICYSCKTGKNQCSNRAAYKKKLAAEAKPGQLLRPIGGYLTQMSQYLVLKENTVNIIDKSIPFNRACLSEPVSCVLHGMNRSRLSIGEVCVVIGAGVMGILHVQLAKLKGATVIVSETDPNRRERAVQAGADFVFDPREEDPAAFVQSHSYGHGGADVVFNTVAISSVFQQGLDMLAPCGRIVAYSSQHPDTPVPIKMGVVHSKEYEIIGTLGSTSQEYYLATQLISRGMVNLDLVVEAEYPMDQCQQAFECAIDPHTYRVIIDLA